MKKLTLDMDELTVTSFEPMAVPLEAMEPENEAFSGPLCTQPRVSCMLGCPVE